MNITVAKHGSIRREPEYVVYCGRTISVGKQYNYALHELANPYRIGIDGTREEVVAKCRVWLWDKLQSEFSGVRYALDWLKRHHDAHGRLVLVCHCHPLPCHCDVIKSCLEWLANN